jgi:hypothetical protein
VLGSIVDVVRGQNPWLAGRNLGPDAGVVAATVHAAVEVSRPGLSSSPSSNGRVEAEPLADAAAQGGHLLTEDT